tara:strand:- start:146 stop:412 length:267 start_codon:yes stop_codon:yes gene_type:complete
MSEHMIDVLVLGKVIGTADSFDLLEDLDGISSAIQYYGFIANDLGRRINLPAVVDFLYINLEQGAFASYNDDGDRTDLKVNLDGLLEE